MRRLLPLLALMLPSAALADHPFILPSATSFSGTGNTATFDAAGSDHVFFFDHRPLAPDTLTVERPDGTTLAPTATRTRFRTVFDLPLDQAGTWKASSTQTGITGMAVIDGVERRVGTRPPGAGAGMPRAGEPARLPPIAPADLPAQATDVHLVETVATTQTFVTVDAPSAAVLKPTGRALEVDWLTHPNSLVANEPARLRLLIDGRPAAGVAVTVLPGGDRWRASDGAVALRSGADGVVTVRWPGAGMHWLGAQAEDARASTPYAERRRMTYAATLEVANP